MAGSSPTTLWGIYFKPDRHSVQGGAAPLADGPRVRRRPLSHRHRGPRVPRHVVRGAVALPVRFEGCRAHYMQVRSGGVGAFTADNFPVFDHMAPNVYVAADSNHGYKMIAVGREIAARAAAASTPRCFTRSASSASPAGDLHPVSHSPYPWS